MLLGTSDVLDPSAFGKLRLATLSWSVVGVHADLDMDMDLSMTGESVHVYARGYGYVDEHADAPKIVFSLNLRHAVIICGVR